MRRRQTLYFSFPCLLLVALVSCTSAVLAPGAEKVVYVKDTKKGYGAELSAQCQVLGVVKEGKDRDSIFCKEECQIELRNRTFALGGDTVVFTGRGSGMAYKCGAAPEKKQ